MEKRGPRVGDSRSLWNFTSAPGWKQDEIQILKLCLMKYGIGQWVKILNTGLLPGKVIQQLNCQTQRLLGQQSLAGYTGLSVDLDRIRLNNEARHDATRKSGLIIYTGVQPTRQMKQAWKREAKEKYGLSIEQLKEVDRELDQIHEQIRQKATDKVPADAVQFDQSLFEVDAKALNQMEQLDLLWKLRKEVIRLVNIKDNLEAKQVHEGQGSKENETCTETKTDGNSKIICTSSHEESKKDKADITLDVRVNGEENRIENVLGSTQLQSSGNCVVSRSPTKERRHSPVCSKDPESTENNEQHASEGNYNLGKIPHTSKPQARQLKVKGKRKGSTLQNRRASKRRGNISQAVEDEFMEEDAVNAAKAAFEADLQTIMSMGYSRRHAREALQEAKLNVETAVEWLLSHCM